MSEFTDKYNTPLSPVQEQAFQAWAKKNQREFDTEDYDLRGAYLEMQSGDMSEAANGHLGDKYKKPNHPTFSDESVYNGVDGYFGGRWSEQDGKTSFQTGETQKNLWKPQDLQRYFQEREPDVQLVVPQPQSLSTGPLRQK